MNGLVSKGEEIIQLSETPMMNGNGNSLAAIKLYEAQVIPALSFNSESWIGLTKTHISELQNFKYKGRVQTKHFGDESCSSISMRLAMCLLKGFIINTIKEIMHFLFFYFFAFRKN